MPWQKDLSHFYNSADVFVSASSYEGYGMAMMEAFLSGLELVLTEAGIASDLEIFEGVKVCPVGDGACLSKTLADRLLLPQHYDSKKRIDLAIRSGLLSDSRERYDQAYLRTFSAMIF